MIFSSILDDCIKVCMCIVVLSDTATRAALGWLNDICLTKFERLNLVQPDIKWLFVPSETQFYMTFYVRQTRARPG